MTIFSPRIREYSKICEIGLHQSDIFRNRIRMIGPGCLERLDSHGIHTGYQGIRRQRGDIARGWEGGARATASDHSAFRRIGVVIVRWTVLQLNRPLEFDAA